MLPGAGKAFHDWSVSIKGSRQEKNGYSCNFGTNKDSLTYLIGWSEYSWGSCQGKLNMIVFKDGKPIDSIVMPLLGGRNDYSLSRTYLQSDIKAFVALFTSSKIIVTEYQ